MDDFDSRLVKATMNWIKGPIMEYLNTNKLDFKTPSKPQYWKSSKGNLFNFYEYSNITEEKLLKDVLLKPLPDEYPYTINYSEEKINFPVNPEFLRSLICYVEFTDLISFSNASKIVFPEMIKNLLEHPWEIIERLNLIQNNDDSEIDKIVKEVLSKYPDKVEEYKKGKTGVLSLFMGDVMKIGKGKINPKTASEIIKNILSV
jgi:Asp-tRNA(Asn)/Glu-tRNA(Gln) amidotransferase B subunit